LRTPEALKTRVFVLTVVILLTVAFHYGWIVEPLFGHIHWIHAIHGRLCYIPIVIAAAWFGLRGGLYAAGIVSMAVLPYAFLLEDPHFLANEMVEIVFYFAIAVLTGILVERELAARHKQQQAQLQMERSQKLSLVGQLAASVAHEIKNPIASIRGAADILTDDDTSAEDREEFKAILRNEIKRIDATVTEFLEFARPKETRLAKLDLSKTVGATLRQIDAHARREGVSIEAQIEEDVLMTGDGEKMHQMVLNLVLNAIQASREGDTIRVSVTGRASQDVRLVISDTGTGIERAAIDHVFDPFFTTRSTGTGLGLAVVKDIVDNHSGEITIDSAPARGTTVTVTFPGRT